MIDPLHGWNVSFKPLIIAFVSSIILTVAAFIIVVGQFLSGRILISTVVGLGVVQALVQLVFFLHLGVESKPRWNLMIFLFMVLIVVVLVGGSLWIMGNLDYNVMPMEGSRYNEKPYL